MSVRAVVTGLTRDASPEQRERIRFLLQARADTPSPEREAARAEIALAVHGLHVEHWACGCGAGYEYPHSSCPACHRAYPRKCLTAGCGNVNEPEKTTTAGGVDCDLVRTYCAACETDQSRRGRARSFSRSSIPPRERQAAQHLIAYPEQAGAVQALEHWLPETQRGMMCGAYIGGQVGRGKSVLAAYTVYRGFVDLGLFPDFRWHSQATLAQLFAERFTGGDEARQQATREWKAVTECPLLVIDDIFAAQLTPAFGEALATLIRERLDQVRATICTSNMAPQWQVYFEHDVGRLQSRWRGYGLELVVGGDDLRRAA